MLNELLRHLLFLPRQASTMAREIDDLHYWVICVTLLGAAGVGCAAVYFAVRYRRTPTYEGTHPGAMAKPPPWFEPVVITCLGALFVAFWYAGLSRFVKLRVAPEDAMDVYVTAKQWMWTFAYPEGNRSVTTLYVPAGRPVKLILTSRDVIHSFFVPDFRVKEDVLPGRYTTLWFAAKEPGTYPILCAELCGVGHSTMRGNVVALAPDDFERWLRRAPEGDPVAGERYVPPEVATETSPAELLDLVRLGEEAAERHGCLRCHTTDGTPHIGPTWAGMVGSTVPLADGTTVIADEAYITESMMDPLARIHRGFEPVMPSFLGRIHPAETAAIIELMRSLRDVPPLPGARTPLPGHEWHGALPYGE
jgi:cytochrome c oxidase subunit II